MLLFNETLWIKLEPLYIDNELSDNELTIFNDVDRELSYSFEVPGKINVQFSREEAE